MSDNNRVPFYTVYADKPPKDIDEHGLTPEGRKDCDILFNGQEPQHVILTTFSYIHHTGKEKVIVGAVYNVARKILPRRLPDLLPPPNPPAYAIRDIPGKGKGVVATRDIALGEVVIVERPVLINAAIMDLKTVANFVQYAKLAMDTEDWDAYFSLENVKDERFPKFAGIMGTNAFEVGLMKGKEHYSGVFLELSRLNHSCGPNLTRSWNPYLFTLSVQAVRPIRAGQELTIAYEDICGTSHADRRYDLERKYKFQCTCGFCTKTSHTSDHDRLLKQQAVVSDVLEHIYGELIVPGLPWYTGREKTEYLLDYLIASMVLITKEGVESAAAFWHYVYSMKVCGLLGDKKRFKDWGFKAVLLSACNTDVIDEKGRREVEQWIEWVKNPEKNFPGWGRYR